MRRLLVPMLFVGTLFALAQSLLPATNFGGTGVKDRNWLLLHVEPVAHFWFVESLLWIFLLTWALERGCLLATPGRFAAVWLLAAAVDLTLPGPPWFAIDGAVYLLPFFLGGLAVSRLSLVPRLGRVSTAALMAVAAVIAIVQIGIPLPNPNRHSPWILLAGMSLCALCVGARLDSAWLARIGASSYAIYLFHVFFTAGSRIALTEAGLTTVPLQIAAGATLGLAAPMLVEHWARRSAWLLLLLLGEPFRRRRAPPSGVRAARPIALDRPSAPVAN